MKKKTTAPKPKPGERPPVTYNGITMRPFSYTPEGFARAVELADAVSHYEDDDRCVALALLIAGIAAIEDSDERESHAFFAIERVLSKTPRMLEAMNEYMGEIGDGAVLVYG